MCLVPQQFLYIFSGTGNCPTKWPFDFLQPRKSLDGNRTCHWIDLIEATGGNSSFYCQIKESLVYVQIQFSCMITDPRVRIEWKIYHSCTTHRRIPQSVQSSLRHLRAHNPLQHPALCGHPIKEGAEATGSNVLLSKRINLSSSALL